jgi:hypothetical protein
MVGQQIICQAANESGDSFRLAHIAGADFFNRDPEGFLK